MKKHILTFLVLVNFSIVKGQTDITFTEDNYKIDNILATLFEGEFNYKTLECKWKPNTAEKLQFGESADGYLYTKLDTSFAYKTRYLPKITLVATTYEKDESGEKRSCHACSPSFSVIVFVYDPSKKIFKLDSFFKYVNRYGGWGEPGYSTPLKIDEFNTLLKVSTFYSSQGWTSEYVTLYEDGYNLLTFTAYEDNSGTTDDKSKLYEFNTKIVVDDVNGKLILTKKGTEVNDKTKKVIKVNQMIIYKFENGSLEKISTQNLLQKKKKK